MKTRFFITAMTAGLLLASCNKDESYVNMQTQFPEDGVMRFTTRLNDAAAVQTRASLTTPDLKQFQIKIVNPASATYSYFETVKPNANGEWIPVNRMLWQNNTSPITMTAAFLGSQEFTDEEFANGAERAVDADQSDQDKLNAQDLLTMPESRIENPSTEQELLSNGKLVITLYHALAKLDVKLDLLNEFYNFEPKLNNNTDITDFTISGTNASYNFQPMQEAGTYYGAVSVVEDSKADILAMQSAFTPASDNDQHSYAKYESILVPQEIAVGALTVSFKIGTRLFSWTNEEAINLQQGKLYTLPLIVGYDKVTLGSNAITATPWNVETGSNIVTE